MASDTEQVIVNRMSNKVYKKVIISARRGETALYLPLILLLP